MKVAEWCLKVRLPKVQVSAHAFQSSREPLSLSVRKSMEPELGASVPVATIQIETQVACFAVVRQSQANAAELERANRSRTAVLVRFSSQRFWGSPRQTVAANATPQTALVLDLPGPALYPRSQPWLCRRYRRVWQPLVPWSQALFQDAPPQSLTLSRGRSQDAPQELRRSCPFQIAKWLLARPWVWSLVSWCCHSC
jgi:hypothetical protein